MSRHRWGFTMPSAGRPSGAADGHVRWSGAAQDRRVLAGAGLVAALGLGLALGGCGAAPVREPGDRAVLAGAGTREPAGAAPAVGVEIDPGPPTAVRTPVGGQPWDAAVSSTCAEALAGGRYAGLAEVAQSADGRGVTSFWARGATRVACDVLLDPAAVEPVLVAVAGGTPSLDGDALTVTSTTVPATGPPEVVRFVAAGSLPARVDELVYTFPDGHEARARFVESADGSGATWWSVTYTATEGVLVDPQTDPGTLGPATVSVVGAAAEAFRLPWEDAVVKVP